MRYIALSSCDLNLNPYDLKIVISQKLFGLHVHMSNCAFLHDYYSGTHIWEKSTKQKIEGGNFDPFDID